VVVDELCWPERGAPMDENGVGGNRDYIARIEAADDPVQGCENIELGIADDPEGEEEPDDLYGLDYGVASVVIGLSATRCIPFFSCNGGAFGGEQHESCPVVAFFARPWMVDVVLECAAEASVGLVNADAGTLIVYAGDTRNMRVFEHALMRRRGTFRALRPRRKAREPMAVGASGG
jgi:hypothetical protein